MNKSLQYFQGSRVSVFCFALIEDILLTSQALGMKLSHHCGFPYTQTKFLWIKDIIAFYIYFLTF